MTRLELLRDLAADCKLYVARWAPGDGQTRYRFGTADNPYFASSPGGPEFLHTAVGFNAAETWIRAYRAGYLAGKAESANGKEGGA